METYQTRIETARRHVAEQERLIAITKQMISEHKQEDQPTELAEKLQTLLDDVGTREQLATRAKQRADALYRWEAIANKYENVFAKLLTK